MVASVSLIIAVIGGGLAKDRRGGWRTTRFSDRGDAYGALGDRLRVLAAAALWRKNKTALVVALGGKGQLSGIKGAPPVARVIKGELVAMGVPVKQIITEQKSGTTHESLFALKNFLKKSDIKKVCLISNQYHLPRIKIMIKNLPELQAIFSVHQVKPTAAEEILVTQEPGVWKKKIALAYRSKKMTKRLVLEEKGIKDLKSGRYKFRQYSPKA